MKIKFRKDILSNTVRVYEDGVVKIVAVSYADADSRARFKWKLSNLEMMEIKLDYDVHVFWLGRE